MKTYILLLISSLLIWSCDSKPKVIESVDATEETQQDGMDPNASKLHKVVVEEVLQTSKYTYLHVTEDGAKIWIAVPKREVKIGGTYYYRGGLKKNNFKSVEFDRVFETLYLVSGVSEDPGMDGMTGSNPHTGSHSGEQPDQSTKIDPPAGGVTIAELFKNRQKYEGQTIKVKGRCVKLNTNIMNRNWIHIQDGSNNEEQLDLTVTTSDKVALGDVVAFEGKITLNKDFGAGYKYEIIMEDAHLLP